MAALFFCLNEDKRKVQIRKWTAMMRATWKRRHSSFMRYMIDLKAITRISRIMRIEPNNREGKKVGKNEVENNWKEPLADRAKVVKLQGQRVNRESVCV
jgi:hypothetical protein